LYGEKEKFHKVTYNMEQREYTCCIFLMINTRNEDVHRVGGPMKVHQGHLLRASNLEGPQNLQ